MSHSHSHVTHSHSGHTHGPDASTRPLAFTIGIGLNLAIVLLEGYYGLRAHSMALLSDAGHNLTDVLSLGIAATAIALANRNPTERRTYGFRRSTILGALLNGVLLMLVVGALAWGAVQRLSQPQSLDTSAVAIVAAIGLVLNLGTAMLFRRGQHDLNVRGAYLHMASDALVSFGVVIGALAIMTTGASWIDPALSLAIDAVIAYSTWRLLADAFNLAMDAVPAEINPRDITAYLASISGIAEVHDLHIWAMSTTETALTVHLVTSRDAFDNSLLDEVTTGLCTQFGIQHPTIQIERYDTSRDCLLSDPAHI